MEKIWIETKKAYQIAATLFGVGSTKSIWIIAPATGVKQSFYRKFATYVSQHRIHVITFDYQGIGRSLQEPIRELDNTAQDWGRTDLESVIAFLRSGYHETMLKLMGHSIGGQLN